MEEEVVDAPDADIACPGCGAHVGEWCDAGCIAHANGRCGLPHPELKSEDERFRLLEARFDSLEAMFSQLMMGYAELSAAMEALMWQLFGSGDSPESQEYREKFERTRAGYIGWLHEAAKDVGIADDSLDARVLRVLSDDQAAPSESQSGSDLSDGPGSSPSQ